MNRIEVEIENIRYALDSETSTATVIRSYEHIYKGIIILPASVAHEGKDYAVTCIGKDAMSFDDEYMDYILEHDLMGQEIESPEMVIIPASVRRIEEKAFLRCINLQGVTLLGMPEYVAEDSFDTCIDMQTILVPRGMKQQAQQMMPHQSELITECVAEIDGLYYHLHSDTMTAKVVDKYPVAAAGDWYKLQNYTGRIQLPSEVEYAGNSYRVREIGRCAFAYSSIEHIDMPNSIEVVGDRAFDSCEKLTEIIFPDSIHTIGEAVLNECDNLVSVRLSNNLRRLEKYSLYGCINLRKVELGNGLQYIGKEVFHSCDELTEIELPASIEMMAEEAFSFSGLEVITLPDGMREVDMRAFADCFCLECITLGKGVERIIPSELEYSDHMVRLLIPQECVEDYCQKGLDSMREYVEIHPLV